MLVNMPCSCCSTHSECRSRQAKKEKTAYCRLEQVGEPGKQGSLNDAHNDSEKLHFLVILQGELLTNQGTTLEAKLLLLKLHRISGVFACMVLLLTNSSKAIEMSFANILTWIYGEEHQSLPLPCRKLPMPYLLAVSTNTNDTIVFQATLA